MQSLSRPLLLLSYVGGLLLLVGAALPLFSELSILSASLFSIGVVAFSIPQWKQRYEGRNITLRRLLRQQLIGTVFLLVSAVLMFLLLFRLPPFHGDVWKLPLLIGAILQIYTAFRISHEWDKEAQ